MAGMSFQACLILVLILNCVVTLRPKVICYSTASFLAKVHVWISVRFGFTNSGDQRPPIQEMQKSDSSLN